MFGGIFPNPDPQPDVCSDELYIFNTGIVISNLVKGKRISSFPVLKNCIFYYNWISLLLGAQKLTLH